MIRVNLLEGTTEQRVATQRTKVAARRGQQLFMLGAALIIFVAAIFGDSLWTNSAQAKAKRELDGEQEAAKKLESDKARKTELEEELKQVEERIRVIKQLRAEQKGPVAMLSAINERMPGGIGGFELQEISQKGNHLKITGSVTDEQTASNFFHQLEFSSGMFANFTFNIVRADPNNPVEDAPDRVAKKVEPRDPKDKKADAKDQKPDAAPAGPGHKQLFTIDCDYNKPRDPSSPEPPANPPQGAQGK